MDNCRKDLVRLLMSISSATILDFSVFEKQYFEFATTYSAEEQNRAITEWVLRDNRYFDKEDLILCPWIRTHESIKFISVNSFSPKIFMYRMFFLSPKVLR